MQILMAYASRMRATEEIAQAIATELRHAGHAVDVASCESAPDVWKYDAVIVGSAIYIGRWDKTAVDYLKRQAQDLADRPVWLFQSGPVGEGAETEQVEIPHAVRKLVERLGLVSPITFGGRLDPARATGPFTRWVATGMYEGDFRDWDRVRDWSASINSALSAMPVGNPPQPAPEQPGS
jgi:menaquinone-dependent protoporphyrinogen oxidase